MIWSTLSKLFGNSTTAWMIDIVFGVLIITFSILYWRSVRQSRRKLAALDQREEMHRVALALVSQNIERHDQEALAAEVNERRRVEASLTHAAYHDRLTGLYNRAFFLHELRNVLEFKLPRTPVQKAILLVDIDGFKAVNETMGQKFGDLLLREVARRLALCTRDQDTLARMGGDEFAILLSDLNGIERAQRIAQRMLSMLEEPALVADIRLSITASIGLCAIDDTYVEAEDLLRDSDIALYYAKRQGGNRHVQYDGSMRSEAFAILQLKQQLKAALTNDEFTCFYMPMVDMTDRSIYGVESLIRWNHPLRGLLAPGEFIQVAEECDLIIGIGRWVLRQSCRDFLELSKLSNRELTLSVNVSSRQLDQESFLSDLEMILKETGMRPSSLQLELLEGVLIENATRMGLLFAQIRNLGVRIAFDDFGTGYSSLSYLARYPIDTLKIDQSFVRNMSKGSINADIVQLVIKLARAIGMQVSAEGVEEMEQAANLIDYGCTVAQGYLYGRPVPLEDITPVIARGWVVT